MWYESPRQRAGREGQAHPDVLLLNPNSPYPLTDDLIAIINVHSVGDMVTLRGVDIGVAVATLAMWRAGINTTMQCQGTPGYEDPWFWLDHYLQQEEPTSALRDWLHPACTTRRLLDLLEPVYAAIPGATGSLRNRWTWTSDSRNKWSRLSMPFAAFPLLYELLRHVDRSA